MDAVDGLSVRVEQNGHGPVVRLSGELDIATSPMLSECLERLDGQAVMVDFSDVTFIDSSGLAVLVNHHKQTGAGKLMLQGVQPALMKVFELTGLDEVFDFEGN